MPRAKKRNNEPMTQPSVASSQNNNILYIMMGVITLFLIFMVVKVISLEKITELKNKAKQLSLKMTIKEKGQNKLKNEAVDKLNSDDLPF